MGTKIVIVGGAACGPKAAARARRRDANAEIILIERGEHLSYAACGLPYYVGGTVAEIDNLRKTTFDVLRDENYFRDVKDIDVRLKTTAEKIDRKSKTVDVRSINNDSAEIIAYDKLVLATGASPFKPPIEGISSKNVFCLHSLDDAAAIREKIEANEVESAVIIGGGLIGLETIESLFNHAVDATVLEMADAILPSLLDRDTAEFLTGEIVREGVEIFCGQKVLRIEESQDATTVVTQDREIVCDMVVLAAGVRPNVALAERAGLTIGSTGAISVNKRMQTSDPDIYAGGDCVECFDIVSRQNLFAPLGSTANKHGRIIGDNVTGSCEEFEGVVGTAIAKILNATVARTGLTESKAKQLGYDVVVSFTPSLDRVHFYPGSKFLMTKLIADRKSGKLLGAQIVGPGNVSKRIDVLATAVQLGATLQQTANLDLGYSPPFSSAMDCIIHAANHTRNRKVRFVDALRLHEARERLQAEDGWLILDVREMQETEKNPIKDRRVLDIPLTRLRSQTDRISNNCKILCCCQQGVRSYEACLILKANGYQSVFYLDGGLRMGDIVNLGE